MRRIHTTRDSLRTRTHVMAFFCIMCITYSPKYWRRFGAEEFFACVLAEGQNTPTAEEAIVLSVVKGPCEDTERAQEFVVATTPESAGAENVGYRITWLVQQCGKVVIRQEVKTRTGCRQSLERFVFNQLQPDGRTQDNCRQLANWRQRLVTHL